MTVELFWDFAARLGLPFALVVLALWTGRSGMWVWGREVTLERAYWSDRLKDERERGAAREAELTKDLEFYRTFAFDALQKAERSSAVAERAVGLAERK